MGQRPHHPQIVADEQIPQLVIGLQLLQQIHDLRLHRHVQRAGRLIQHHEARFQHDGPGDGDALALAAAEFVRIAAADIARQTDLLQRRRRPQATLRA